MPYIDPIELLQLAVPRDGDLQPEDLRRAKRKLQAEFELSGKVTIPYRGGEIDRSTAMQAAEALEDPTQRAHYIRLHRHRELQEFLRTPQVRLLARVPASDKLGDAAYIKFIGERLAPIYIDLLGTQVRRKDWVAAALLLNRLDLLDSWQHEEVLKPFINHIRLCHRQLTEVNSSTAETWKGLWEEQLIDMRMMEAMNRLPKTFQEQRNQYARLLANVSLHMHDPVGQITLAHMVILAAAKLDVDHASKERVNKVQAWIWSKLLEFRKFTTEIDDTTQKISATLEQARARTEASSKSGWTGSRVFLLLAVVISMVSLSLRFCTKRSAPTYYLPPQFDLYNQKDDSLLLRELNRTTATLLDSGQQNAVDSAAEAVIDVHHDGGTRQTRYDTIFFRDLIFYETLNDIHPLSQPGPAFTPQDGSSPYAGILPPPRAPWDKVDEPEQLRLVNRSKYGVVLFFEPLTGGQVLHNYYLGPGSKFLLRQLPTGFYMVRSYHGRDMRKACATYLGKPIPAFRQQASKVSTEADTEGRDLPDVHMLYHHKAFNFGDKKDPPKELIFDEDLVLKSSE